MDTIPVLYVRLNPATHAIVASLKESTGLSMTAVVEILMDHATGGPNPLGPELARAAAELRKANHGHPPATPNPKPIRAAKQAPVRGRNVRQDQERPRR